MPDIRILPLQQRPQVLDDIAQWHFNEWQALYPQDSLQDFRTDLASTMSGDIQTALRSAIAAVFQCAGPGKGQGAGGEGKGCHALAQPSSGPPT